MYQTDFIVNHYTPDNNEEGGEEERFASQSGQVEFLTTMRYIERYLFSGAKILEIGAGTGRYSCSLAKKGYEVDAIELVPYNLEILRGKIETGWRLSSLQGDARDLSVFKDNTYDITLLLGPLYHMFIKEDKDKTISEALRVTKPGGIVFAAYCMSDASIMSSGFRRQTFSVADFIKKGFINVETFETSSAPELIFEIVRKEQVDDLMSEFNAERLHFVATDLYTNHMKNEVNLMDAKEFELYLKYHFTICERPDMLGLSHHTLDVFRKTSD